jgi:hypothetical protein
MAVSEEKYERALELAKLLNSVKLLDSALAIAEFYRVTSLAEKINKLKSVSYLSFFGKGIGNKYNIINCFIYCL